MLIGSGLHIPELCSSKSYIYIHICIYTYIYISHVLFDSCFHIFELNFSTAIFTVIAHHLYTNRMGWLRLVGSFKLQVSFAKEPYKRDYILQKRPIILRRLLIVATPYALNFLGSVSSVIVHTECLKSNYYSHCTQKLSTALSLE